MFRPNVDQNWKTAKSEVGSTTAEIDSTWSSIVIFGHFFAKSDQKLTKIGKMPKVKTDPTLLNFTLNSFSHILE